MVVHALGVGCQDAIAADLRAISRALEIFPVAGTLISTSLCVNSAMCVIEILVRKFMANTFDLETSRGIAVAGTLIPTSLCANSVICAIEMLVSRLTTNRER